MRIPNNTARPAPAGDPARVLELREVTKTFGSVVANDRVSLDVRRGEVLGLLGENGAGKSTLMKVLYGLYRADSGELRVDGEPVSITSPRDAVRLGIGMVHQHFLLVPPLTVAENVVLGAEPGGLALDRRGAERRVAELAERYGLAVDPRARVDDLSVGVQQRVEILKALYRDARILVLDEPTAVLTPQEAHDLFSTLRTFVDQGLSVILITHKLGELLAVADRVTVIRDGRVVDTVPASGTSEARLAQLMVGREVVLRVHKPAVTPGPVRLEARDLRVAGVGGREAVRGVSLAVHGGEILAVAGVDGNGQVELAEALAGTRLPSSGAVEMDGSDVTRLDAAARRGRGLAYIPEDRSSKGLVADFSVADNLVLKSFDEAPFARRGWLQRPQIRRHAAERVAAFDVRPRDVDARAGSLSGGNQQKAIVARELGGDPGVVIAAQPTRGVDVGAIEFIHARLLEQRAAGSAILLLSLELDEVRALADRIVVIAAGAIVGEVDPADASDELLGLWMAGRTEEAARLLAAGPRR